MLTSETPSSGGSPERYTHGRYFTATTETHLTCPTPLYFARDCNGNSTNTWPGLPSFQSLPRDSDCREVFKLTSLTHDPVTCVSPTPLQPQTGHNTEPSSNNFLENSASLSELRSTRSDSQHVSPTGRALTPSSSAARKTQASQREIEIRSPPPESQPLSNFLFPTVLAGSTFINTPLTMVKVEDSKPVITLWDSGAQRSLVSLDFLTKLHLDKLLTPFSPPLTTPQLHSASGHTLKCLGQCQLRIRFPNLPFLFPFEFLVVQQLTAGLILGFDFQRRYDFSLHPAHGIIMQDNQFTIPLLSSFSPTSTFLILEKSIKIPPHTGRIITVTQANARYTTGSFIVEAHTHAYKDPYPDPRLAPRVQESIVHFEPSGTTRVIMLNHTHIPFYLQKGSVVATARKLDEATLPTDMQRLDIDTIVSLQQHLSGHQAGSPPSDHPDVFTIETSQETAPSHTFSTDTEIPH